MTNAAAVARALKKAGITTAPRHGRDGLWVAGKGRVTMGVNYTAYSPPSWARHLVAAATEALAEAGYTVTPFDSADESLLHSVTKEA